MHQNSTVHQRSATVQQIFEYLWNKNTSESDSERKLKLKPKKDYILCSLKHIWSPGLRFDPKGIHISGKRRVD